MTQAKPFFHSLAVPFAKAMGNIPIAIANVVIRIGRIRSCRLYLAHLPLAPGKTVAVTLEVAEPSVRLALCGVYETARWNRVGTNAPKIKTTLFYREQLGHFQLNDGRLCFDLAIPVAAPITRLAEPPLTYWELIVSNQNGKESIILLPVY